MPFGPSMVGGKDEDERVGTRLADRYRIDRLVDTGAMGRVYVGEHVLMRKRVAIKVLHRELSMVPEFVQRFEREAMAAANIADEHVVAATDFGKLADGAVFLVLEYIEGKNLRDEIDRGPMPTERALRIARQIAVALKSAHDLEIVHRDLKPENVMLIEKSGDPDFVKVLDFGIAKVPIGEPSKGAPGSDRPITKAGMVFGTPEYMPPEQALGQDVDQRADLYALGVILYELLCGVRPFSAESQVAVLGQQLAMPAPPPSQRVPSLSIHAGVERFVLRLLQREASNRPSTAQEVLDEIDRLLGNPKGRGERLLTLNEGTAIALPEPASPGTFDGSSRSTSGEPYRPSFGPLGRLVDRHRARLPGSLRELPAPVLVAGPAAVLSAILGIVLVTSFSKGAPDSAATARPGTPDVAASVERSHPARLSRATPEEIAAASSAGMSSLSALEARYPKDAAVHMAVSAAHLKANDLIAAVRSIGEAISLDPSLTRDKQVSSVLWIAAQNKKSSEAAFSLLKGPMGERGKEILRDLVHTAGVRKNVKEQARKLL